MAKANKSNPAAAMMAAAADALVQNGEAALSLAAQDADKSIAAEADAGEDGKVTVTVIGPASGRRRAGFSFGPNPSVVNVTAEQLKILRGDALLSVSEGRISAEATAELEAQGGVHVLADRNELIAYEGKITVIGPTSGRRRADQTFGKEPVTFQPTPAELKAILADTALSVSPA